MAPWLIVVKNIYTLYILISHYINAINRICYSVIKIFKYQCTLLIFNPSIPMYVFINTKLN